MKKVIISPSLLSANFANLKEEIEKVQNAGAEWLHFDVMDGHFVPNISFGIPVLKSIAKIHNMINDVHIMIENPWKYARAFIEAGADYLTFHLEACDNDEQVKNLIDDIHRYGAKVGLSIKPNTPVERVYPFLKDLDMVLIMSVEPGFGGQSFMHSALDKILRLRYEIEDKGYETLIEVDGGINEKYGPLCTFYGADVLVAGSYLFGHDDLKERLEKLK